MGLSDRKFRLQLLGAFRLFAPDGSRVRISGRRSKALIAMLATARDGERSRDWLQDRLWGSRDRSHAQASLRRELSNLRPVINLLPTPVITADHDRVTLDLQSVAIDVRESPLPIHRGEFLEGIDIGWEEGFEDWLREERQMIAHEREAAAAKGGAPPEVTRPPQFRGRPTITVLVAPHRLEGRDAAVIDGIADQIIDRLARLRWLPLVGAPSGSLRVDSADDLVRAGTILGADYLLLCRSTADRRFQISVSATITGQILWTAGYPLGAPVTSAEVEKIATEAVAALAARIETEQELRVRDLSIPRLSADELVWRARWHMKRLTRNDAAIADQLLEQAALANPFSTDVMIEQAHSRSWKLWNEGAPPDPIRELRALVVRARDADPYDARAPLLLGVLDFWLGRHESAASLMREAIALNPSLAPAYGQLGSCLALSGNPEQGIRHLRTALSLNPLDTQNFHQFGELALAHLMLGLHADAVRYAEEALARRPAYVHAHALKTAALWASDCRSDARKAAQALLDLRPDYQPSALDWLPFRDSHWNKRLKQWLGEAINEARRASKPSAKGDSNAETQIF
jgi:tetratricopeptide (TPR) repeat protein